jgi:hypothetical protein
MRTYEAKVRAGNGIVMPVTVEAENRMYAIEMVNGMYGAENVLMPAYEVFEAYKRTPVRAPAPSVDALSEARIREKEANAYKYAPDFSYAPSYSEPAYASAHSYSSSAFSDNDDLALAKFFLWMAPISVVLIAIFN